MKNVTVKLDDETAAWVRVHAAERGTSVSALLAEMLRERMRHDREYETAYRHWKNQELRPLSAPGESYPTRDSLYDRPGIRR